MSTSVTLAPPGTYRPPQLMRCIVRHQPPQMRDAKACFDSGTCASKWIPPSLAHCTRSSVRSSSADSEGIMQLEVSGSLAAMCTRLLILITSTKPVTCRTCCGGLEHRWLLMGTEKQGCVDPPQQCWVIRPDLIEETWVCQSIFQIYYPNNSC